VFGGFRAQAVKQRIQAHHVVRGHVNLPMNQAASVMPSARPIPR
jgi:hypothetical protein